MPIVNSRLQKLNIWKKWKLLISNKIVYHSFYWIYIKYKNTKWKTNIIKLNLDDEFYFNWKLKTKNYDKN